MPINYTITETKYGKQRREGKTAAALHYEFRGHLPIEEFVDAGYDAKELKGFFELEEVLEASLRPEAARFLYAQLQEKGAMSKVPTQTVGQLLMAESVVEGTAGAHSPLYDLARHASQDCRKLVDFLLKRDFTLVAPAICATVASPPRVEAFVRLMKKWGKRTEIHRAVVTAILPDLEEHALMKQSVISKLLAVKAARRWCYKLAECSRAMSRVLRQLIGVKKRLTMSERADKYVAKVMAHRRGEIRMGESESDSDSQKSTSSDSDDMDAPMGKDPRRVLYEEQMAAYEAYKRAKRTPEMKRRDARMEHFTNMKQDEADAALTAMQQKATAHVEAREWEDALWHMNEAEALVRARRGAMVDPVVHRGGIFASLPQPIDPAPRARATAAPHDAIDAHADDRAPGRRAPAGAGLGRGAGARLRRDGAGRARVARGAVARGAARLLRLLGPRRRRIRP